jgi:hypothetical protein
MRKAVAARPRLGNAGAFKQLGDASTGGPPRGATRRYHDLCYLIADAEEARCLCWRSSSSPF